MLEAYLRGHPEKEKSQQEKEDMRKHYKPGDDVLPLVSSTAANNHEDERLVAEARGLSMADVHPARRHAARNTRRRSQETYQHYTARSSEGQPGVEHQRSLRSLLSASELDPENIRGEILQSIVAGGLLEGVDLENLTPEQEEQLTERIADAYRRRQRRRDRSRNRDHHSAEVRAARLSAEDTPDEPQQSSPGRSNVQARQQARTRQPIVRPHLFEQNLAQPPRSERRANSSVNENRTRQASRDEHIRQATRSATDLSQRPSTEDMQRRERRRPSGNQRTSSASNVGAANLQAERRRHREADVRADTGTSQRADAPEPPLPDIRQRAAHFSNHPAILGQPEQSSAVRRVVHAVMSRSAFAPELLEASRKSPQASTVECDRCRQPDIQHDLHYNCSVCNDGNFNLCLRCYRNGQGCHYWFGYGFRAFDRWQRTSSADGPISRQDRPHILLPRRYTKPTPAEATTFTTQTPVLQEGAFCESCFAFTNDCYWYCNVCLEGAWGFCSACVKKGKHCTHPLLSVAHINTLRGEAPRIDPSQMSFVGMPHLRQDCYVQLPVTTICDLCRWPISPNQSRYHCHVCKDGDLDFCTACYHGLVAQGKISQVHGHNGWRRCLQSHRMVVIGYQDTLDGGHLRLVVRELVGGCAMKEDEVSLGQQPPQNGFPPDGGVGFRCLGLYNYFPADGVEDELAMPKNAEVREVEDKNGDWCVGVYAGEVKLFPSNHVRRL